MRVPREACLVVFRTFSAEIIEHQEGVKAGLLPAAECPPQPHSSALQGGTALEYCFYVSSAGHLMPPVGMVVAESSRVSCKMAKIQRTKEGSTRIVAEANPARTRTGRQGAPGSRPPPGGRSTGPVETPYSSARRVVPAA